ncbi:MAG: response regulator transcription factor [Eubacterium sp.]|nr:response regulator transcription factor [Eubacterium sp.]
MDTTILIVEDDIKIARIIELQLTHAGFGTLRAADGQSALQSFEANPNIDLILLDVMLPGPDGFAILKAIRQKNPQLPVIFLTARDDTADIVRGLSLGADDYITKPFVFDELLARIQANLRKKQLTATGHTLCFKDLTVDLDSFTARRGDSALSLSRTEFDLLHHLVLNHDIVQSREQILDHVWGYDYEGSAKVVDVYIKYLRDKIDKPFETKLIQTIRGRGYVIR